MADPILTPDNSRFVLFPIKYDDLFSLYKKHVDLFWRAEEIDLSKDMNDWEKLGSDEQHFISMVLAFFAGSDGIIIENIAGKFITDVQLPEARAFYSFQIAMEAIHSQTYSLLIDTYIRSNETKEKLFNAIDNFPCIRKKAEWAQKYIHCSCPFETRLVAFACVEGIFFSGAFCSIYWLKKRGLMAGLCFSNELISRDEALHCEFAILLYSKLLVKMKPKLFEKLIRDAVEIELEFICDALPCRLIGMNCDLMSQYIKFVADRLSVQMGYAKIYEVQNPFAWMELISIEQKVNFFEAKVSQYSLADKGGSFSIDDNF
jgi:ribonucleoside-diphosphate reductase subunit M2